MVGPALGLSVGLGLVCLRLGAGVLGRAEAVADLGFFVFPVGVCFPLVGGLVLVFVGVTVGDILGDLVEVSVGSLGGAFVAGDLGRPFALEGALAVGVLVDWEDCSASLVVGLALGLVDGFESPLVVGLAVDLAWALVDPLAGLEERAAGLLSFSKSTISAVLLNLTEKGSGDGGFFFVAKGDLVGGLGLLETFGSKNG